MNKKTTLVKEDINRGRFELIKESPSGHGVYVEKSLIERRYLNLAIYRYMQLPHLLNLLSSPHEFYVANRQSFSDLRDKMAIVKKMEEIKSVYSEAESWKNRRYLREKKEKIRKAWQQCISCWCLDIRNSGINTSFQTPCVLSKTKVKSKNNNNLLIKLYEETIYKCAAVCRFSINDIIL